MFILPVSVGFVNDEVANGQFYFPSIFAFPSQYLPPVLRSHLLFIYQRLYVNLATNVTLIYFFLFRASNNLNTGLTLHCSYKFFHYWSVTNLTTINNNTLFQQTQLLACGSLFFLLCQHLCNFIRNTCLVSPLQNFYSNKLLTYS
jgi:hypothetical protein